MKHFCIPALSALILPLTCLQSAGLEKTHLKVVDFLPADFVTDGSVSYEKELQAAIDAVPPAGGTLTFPAVTFLLNSPAGLQLRSHLSLEMRGTTFLAREQISEDGQIFKGEAITDLSFNGGKIVGRNDTWPDGVNIRGIYLTGECKGIRISGMEIRDLSSNGIGVFAEDAEHPATDVWITDTIIDNCSNQYGDYRAPEGERRGPEKGSDRKDQGVIALYHVHDFTIRGCRFEDSRSDGTHFFFCERGQITDCKIYRAKMGGYFLESCQQILATGNVIRDNGSRGVTIERGSQFCTLTGNTIEGSGREGLWIPDSLRCVVSGNIFSLNGRKENGDTLNTIWNANITINQARGDKLNTPTAHYLIADNIIETDHSQVAAIRVDTRNETGNITISGNMLIGENRKIIVEGPDQGAVTIGENSGAEVERIEGTTE
ncbi:MAG: right-handed parallel beta-helix repeat-containing protein [Verrucomicrobiales bacterium]|nr:right-handed parallel beta-helix repeat-containing protein [Verrucomicrobiales bacterium]